MADRRANMVSRTPAAASWRAINQSGRPTQVKARLAGKDLANWRASMLTGDPTNTRTDMAEGMAENMIQVDSDHLRMLML